MILLGTVLLDLLLHLGSAKSLAGICSLLLGRVVCEDAYSLYFLPTSSLEPDSPIQAASKGDMNLSFVVSINSTFS